MAILRDDGAGLDEMDLVNDGGDYHRNKNDAGARRSAGGIRGSAAKDRPDWSDDIDDRGVSQVYSDRTRARNTETAQA